MASNRSVDGSRLKAIFDQFLKYLYHVYNVLVAQTALCHVLCWAISAINHLYDLNSASRRWYFYVVIAFRLLAYQYNVYGAVIMPKQHCESSPWFTRWVQHGARWPPTFGPSRSAWTMSISPPVGCQLTTLTIAILLLLSPKADTHFTIPRRVEGWVDLDRDSLPARTLTSYYLQKYLLNRLPKCQKYIKMMQGLTNFVIGCTVLFANWLILHMLL